MENTNLFPVIKATVIGTTIASLIFRNLFLGLFLGSIIALVAYQHFKGKSKYKNRVKYFGGESEFMTIVLGIASEMVKVDGNQSSIELKFVDLMLEKNFDSQTSLHLKKQFRLHLKKELDLNRLCRKVNAEFEAAGRIQLMQFLCGIATCDGSLSDAEYRFLLNVGKETKIPFRTFRSILALYNFRTEEQTKNHHEKFHQKKQQTASFNALKTAYAILELEESVSDLEVKKAYRNLAKKHHPDRVIHMGIEFQQMAKERFQKIQEAYELIKNKRGFS